MFELQELQVLRTSLNVIDIKGGNAQFISSLQLKIEKEIIQIEEKTAKEIAEGPPQLRK
jgi:hypothetical protein|tara:strand:- start:19147 stop:19323 length:177 start_codon:yes stop_codon:yes gene_type:complete